MRTFSDTVRLLMDRRGLTGAALSREIELSKTSISKILQGHSKPKQVTFSRLMKALCRSPEEEQMMLKGFTGEAYELPELVVEETETNEAEEIARAKRYLEMKTQSIAFKKSVARELDKAGISYEQDYCEGIYSTDFLIEFDGLRIALECKYNVRRDCDKTRTVATLLLSKLPCDRISILVPFVDPADITINQPFKNIRIETVQTFTTRVNQKRKRGLESKVTSRIVD